MKWFAAIALFLIAGFFVAPATGKPKPCKRCYCSVTATEVNFGSYDSLSQQAVNSAGSVEISCGTDTIGDVLSYSVELSGAKKGSTPREMKGPSGNSLTYNLYTDVGRAIIWGDGKGSTATVTDSYTFTVLCCVTRTYTDYGRLDGGQNVRPGIYSDSITISVDF